MSTLTKCDTCSMLVKDKAPGDPCPGTAMISGSACRGRLMRVNEVELEAEAHAAQDGAEIPIPLSGRMPPSPNGWLARASGHKLRSIEVLPCEVCGRMTEHVVKMDGLWVCLVAGHERQLESELARLKGLIESESELRRGLEAELADLRRGRRERIHEILEGALSSVVEAQLVDKEAQINLLEAEAGKLNATIIRERDRADRLADEVAALKTQLDEQSVALNAANRRASEADRAGVELFRRIKEALGLYAGPAEKASVVGLSEDRMPF